MKYLIAAFLLLFPNLLFAQAPAAPPVPPVAASAYILRDFTSGQVLAGNNVDQHVEPASLTKLMTAYLVFSAIKQKHLKPEQAVPVSKQAWRAEGSRMFIEPNKPVTADELLRGMIVQSGNDASIALAEAVAGNEAVFAQLMNKEAARLGMKNTRFVNATGLPHKEHYSTAADLSLLAAALIRDFPDYYGYYSLKEYSYNNITQPNRNRLLWNDPYVDGIKTGHTENAGYCFVGSAKRGQQRMISVVLGTTSNSVRFTETQKLLNYGFQFYETVQIYKKGQVVSMLPIWKGAAGTMKAGLNQDFYLTLPKGASDRLKASLESKQPLIAPIVEGNRVGTLRVELEGKTMAELPVVALEGVPVAGIFGRMWDSIRLFFE
jgi:serine-type D-Ala-D-Ala carboxypeptidase (penicillin-binding protein 5/6)